MPGSPIAGSRRRLRGRRRSGATTSWKGVQLTSPQHEAKPAASSVSPRVSGPRGSRAGLTAVKAMDGTWDPGAGAQEPPGVMGVEWSEGRPGNWREPPRPRSVGAGARPSITGDPGKWRPAERQSEGAIGAWTAMDNTTRLSKGPYFTDAQRW